METELKNLSFNGDGNDPVTKREFVEAMHILDQAFRHVVTKEEAAALIAHANEEIKHHFDIAVENIEDALRGANADEISAIKDTQKQHAKRIAIVERKAN